MTYFSEDDQDGNAHPEPAAWFDYSAVERGLGTVEAMEAGDASASDMLSLVVAVCVEGVENIKGKGRRARMIGSRLVCLSAIMRPGQAVSDKSAEIQKTLGVSRMTAFRIMSEVRRRMAKCVTSPPSMGGI